MSKLIAFYRGEGTDARGRTLAEVGAFSDGRMEAVHDFIQWLFPLRESSRFNPDAPLLTDADVAAFRAEPALREALRASLVRFLAFLGLAIEGERVVEGTEFALKADVWRFPNHNWLRITRVLASTRTLGLEAESAAVFVALKKLRDGGETGIEAPTFAYWSATQRDL